MSKLTSDSSLYRVIDKLIPENKEELLEKINGKEALKIKFGTDPTGADMHFGHAVNLWALRDLQQLGHKVDLIIGDATARIGDPTGRDMERPELSEEEIHANAKKFHEQISKILSTDHEVFELHRNSKWYNEMSSLDFIQKALRPITLNRLIERSTFRKRVNEGHPIHGHELVYQLLQGYDSLHLNSDIALCGNDQLTNEIMGRTLQQFHHKNPQSIITTRITPGIDGKEKQSKSLGNYIGLNHSAPEQFRRIMSIPDSLVTEYFEVYTDLETGNITSLINQFRDKYRDLKMILAQSMLRRYHPAEVIQGAKESYEKSAHKNAPDDTRVCMVDEVQIELIDFAKKNLGLSKNQFRGLIKNGAVSVDGKKISNQDIDQKGALSIEIMSEICLKYGKNNWVKIKKNPSK